MTIKKSLEVCVAGHTCLDVRHSSNKASLKIIKEIQPGATENPVGNLTYITYSIPQNLVNRMAGFIREASEVPNGVATGGTVSNCGIPLSYLLGSTGVVLMAKRGLDPVGDKIEEIVKSHHKGPLVFLRGNESSSYTIIVQVNGQSHYFHCPGSNDAFGPDDLNWDLIKDSRFFAFGYPPLMKKWHVLDFTLGDSYKKAKDLGCRTYLDMHGGMGSDNRKWQRILKNALMHVDVFNPNLEEALSIADPDYLRKLREREREEKEKGNLDFDVIDAMDNPRAILTGFGDYYHSIGARAVLIKCGKHGLYLSTNKDNPNGWKNIQVFVPAYIPKELVDTTGAGDNVMAAVIAGDVRGYDAIQCLELGVAAGLRNVESQGSTSLRSFNDLKTINRIRRKSLF